MRDLDRIHMDFSPTHERPRPPLPPHKYPTTPNPFTSPKFNNAKILFGRQDINTGSQRSHYFGIHDAVPCTEIGINLFSLSSSILFHIHVWFNGQEEPQHIHQVKHRNPTQFSLAKLSFANSKESILKVNGLAYA